MTRRTAHPPPRRVRTRRGFTIISLLMAMILLTVGILALAGANGQTVTMQTVSQNRTSAIAIARAYMEQVRTRDPWSIESEGEVGLDNQGTEVADGPYKRTLTVTATRNNLIQLEVSVTYPRGVQPVQLTTSFFRGNGLTEAP